MRKTIVVHGRVGAYKGSEGSEGLGRYKRTSKGPCRASRGKTDGHMAISKLLGVLQDIIPFGSAAQKAQYSST